jgi:hypothetical protein
MFHYSISKVTPDSDAPKPLPVPERWERAVPQAATDEQRKWNALGADFVADIEGRPFSPYLTFRDGWRYQCAIDAIRSGDGWTILESDLE